MTSNQIAAWSNRIEEYKLRETREHNRAQEEIDREANNIKRYQADVDAQYKFENTNLTREWNNFQKEYMQADLMTKRELESRGLDIQERKANLDQWKAENDLAIQQMKAVNDKNRTENEFLLGLKADKRTEETLALRERELAFEKQKQSDTYSINYERNRIERLNAQIQQRRMQEERRHNLKQERIDWYSAVHEAANKAEANEIQETRTWVNAVSNVGTSILDLFGTKSRIKSPKAADKPDPAAEFNKLFNK